MLHLRLLSALILIVSVVSLIVIDVLFPIGGVTGLWLLPVGLFFVAGTAWEFASMTSQRHGTEPAVVTAVSGAAFLLSCFPLFYEWIMQKDYPPDCPIGLLGWPLLSAMFACSVFSLLAMRKYNELKERTLEYWSVSTLICLYVGIAGCFWSLIRTHDPEWFGLLCMIGVIATTKFGDAGAYFVGKSIGKRKLCPSISPGKTVEGAIGALVTSAIISVIFFAVIGPQMGNGSMSIKNVLQAILFGLTLATVGLVGDLAESIVKRSMQRKDSGNLLPGLGGIWDVTDSILPTAIVGYVFIALKFIWTP